MIKIILSGCNGRMGQAVVRQAKNSNTLKIIAGYDAMANLSNEFPVYDQFSNIKEDADIVIDFSHITATPAVLNFCKTKKIPLVLATTGIAGELEKQVIQTAEKIPIFKSFNMSLGISLLQALVQQATKVLGDTYDIEIIEKHHNQKVDAPSGTAIMIAQSAASVLNYQPEFTYDRTQKDKKRAQQEIGIHAVRGGSIIGDHDVMYIGPNDILTISHSAQSRELFANGALKAAEFLMKKTLPTIYNMDDLVSSLVQ